MKYKKIYVVILEKKCRKDKQETEEIGYLWQVGGKKVERKREWDWCSMGEMWQTLSDIFVLYSSSDS